MRISDWSSDVCSSDLQYAALLGAADDALVRPHQCLAVDIFLEKPLAHHQPERLARAAIGFVGGLVDDVPEVVEAAGVRGAARGEPILDRKSTRLNSSH